MANVLVNAPKTARKGDTVEIKALILHPMETGFRPGTNGRIIPRNIIEHFTCTYNGVEVFSAELHPAISANPYLSFFTVATESGTIAFEWRGDNGFAVSASATITVA